MIWWHEFGRAIVRCLERGASLIDTMLMSWSFSQSACQIRIIIIIITKKFLGEMVVKY